MVMKLMCAMAVKQLFFVKKKWIKVAVSLNVGTVSNHCMVSEWEQRQYLQSKYLQLRKVGIF